MKLSDPWLRRLKVFNVTKAKHGLWNPDCFQSSRSHLNAPWTCEFWVVCFQTGRFSLTRNSGTSWHTLLPSTYTQTHSERRGCDPAGPVGRSDGKIELSSGCSCLRRLRATQQGYLSIFCPSAPLDARQRLFLFLFFLSGVSDCHAPAASPGRPGRAGGFRDRGSEQRSNSNKAFVEEKMSRLTLRQRRNMEMALCIPQILRLIMWVDLTYIWHWLKQSIVGN